MECRHCKTELNLSFIDLGSAPPSNAYLNSQMLNLPEKWFPLRVLVCENCWLVQTEDYANASELFDQDYAYFSSFSQTMLEHSKNFVNKMLDRYRLNESSMVVEVAANDGYLLQYIKDKSIPCLGIEPTASTAESARSKGIPIVEDFFGVNLAKKLLEEGVSADLTIANNVLAHVPDINDFVEGFSILLKADGVASFEFPYLVNLIESNQFDTIYHEHFSYFSLTSVNSIFSANGLSIFDVELIDTHGGSLRVFAQRSDKVNKKLKSNMVQSLLNNEKINGYLSCQIYNGFQERSEKLKDDLLKFLIKAKEDEKSVYAFGAAAKGNTFINFAGIKPDLIRAVADSNPAKQGKYMPGSRIPIISENFLKASKPNYIVILPWNLKEEIITNLTYMRDWGCLFVVAIPELRVL
jgi:SAM-dependent methyltransferase